MALVVVLTPILSLAQSRVNSEEMRQLSKFNKFYGLLVGA